MRDIRLEGLQRISAGTVFTYLPVKVGERLDDQRSAEAIRALFKTGFFQDVRLERQGDVLVVILKERPAIAEIDISGNESIDTDKLKKSLRDVGLAEGRVFDRSVLENVEQELRRQYFNQGRYAVRLKTDVVPQPRNRVMIKLKIVEGEVAKIRDINIVGNHSFPEKQLLGLFKLGVPGTFSFFSDSDKYSKQKLTGDLETLRSFYLDRGFIKFNLDSTQVSITPDKKDVYITVNISEGKRYKVSHIKVAGDLVVPAKQLLRLVSIEPGTYFSGKSATESANKITERLGDDGYAFANVNTVPDIDEKTHTVALTFFVDPGKRVYVRRINIHGNDKTYDEVIRRELRQMEGGWLSTKEVKLSRERLQRLGYFQDVNVQTPAVPGIDDQVDLDLKVTEKPSGSLTASIGYSDTQGVIFNISVNQDNFLGHGTHVGFTMDNSTVNKTYSFSYDNPYYTLDGVSRGFSVFVRKTDASAASLSQYVTDAKGGSVNYGIPLTETDRLGFSAQLQNTKIKTTTSSPLQVNEFITNYGDTFDTLTLSSSWSRDSRDRAFFASRGSSIRAQLDLTGGDLDYYQLSYKHGWYHPLTKNLTLGLKGYLGYGDGYGRTTALPFFANYFAGGVNTVRGYSGNSLGPRDSNNDPIGGNLELVANAEIIFPLPWLADSSSVRMSAFVDAGNIYNTKLPNYSSDPLRMSAGVAVNWFSPVGPLIFSWASPLNAQPGDKTQTLQFSLGFAF